MKLLWSNLHWTDIRFPLLGAGLGCLGNSFGGGYSEKLNAAIAIIGICGFVIVSAIKICLNK